MNQCPTKDKGKAPPFNMVTTKIQQVTSRSKTKQSEWEIQEAMCKTAKEWVEESNNNNNVSMMLQESKVPMITSDKSVSRHKEALTDTAEEDDETWQALADSFLLSLSANVTKISAPYFRQSGSNHCQKQDRRSGS